MDSSNHLLCLILFPLLCLFSLSTAQNSRRRFVITFHNGSALEQFDKNATEVIMEAAMHEKGSSTMLYTIEKWYGRRIVISFEEQQHAVDFQMNIKSIQTLVPNIKIIEEDSLLLAEEDNLDQSDLLVTSQILWMPYNNSNITTASWSSTANESTTVAVLDSGLSSSSRHLYRNLIEGYDFITSLDVSLDSDGRDPDWTDPGDANPPQCNQSSWHGTLVANVLAAAPERNEFNFSGILPDATIISVRVLGACKMGYASDVADAIVWAAGGRIDSLNGAKPNATAKVILMAFAGYAPDGCPDFLQSAVNLAVSMNVTLVAAAGNSNGQHASHYAPGNCRGVISVGALDDKGNLAAYSNVNASVNAFGGPMQCLDHKGESLGQMCMGTSFAAAVVAGNVSSTGMENLDYYANKNSSRGENISLSTQSTCNAACGSNPKWCTTYNRFSVDKFEFRILNVNYNADCTASISMILNIEKVHVIVDASLPVDNDRVYVKGCSGMGCTVLQTISGSATNSVTVFRSQYHTVQIQYTTDATGPSGIPPSGSFSPSVGVTYTQICPLATSFQVNAQATTCSTCSVCPVGQYVSTGCGTQSDIQCTDCSPGKYADTPNFLVYDANSFRSCQLCTAGKFSGTAFSTCVTCSTGSFWSSISSSCEQCNSAGKYWASPESTCKNCQIGKYSTNSAAGVTVCTDCNPGTAATSPGLTTCSPCGLGRYASSASVCTNCLAGTYWDQATTANTACPECSTGTAATVAGLSACSTCGLGKYASSASVCTNCLAGKYWDQATTATTACLNCVGNTISSAGSSTCASSCSPDFSTTTGHTGATQ